jgi:hypothetical protein
VQAYLAMYQKNYMYRYYPSNNCFSYNNQKNPKYCWLYVALLSIFFYIGIGKVGQTLFHCGKSTFL